MTEIMIPISVEERMKSERRGINRQAIIEAYLSPLFLAGEQLDSYRRDKDGRLIAVTATIPQPDPDIPQAFKKKPKR